MKIKSWLKSILAGIAIGISSAIPGVSGGTVAVIFKVYEKILWAVSNIFIQAKKAVIILLPILIGLVIGIVPTIILVDKALINFLFGLICVFAGFIIGSIPQITSEIKNAHKKTSNYICLSITALIAILLGLGSIIAKSDTTSLFMEHPWWFYLVMIPVGFVSSSALVIPGISGGLILILLGFYSPLINFTVDILKECLTGNWSRFPSHFGLLMCFLIGVIIGFYLVSKLMNTLLKKHHDITFYGILGFIAGSIVSLFLNYKIWGYYVCWSQGNHGYLIKEVEIPLGIALLIISSICAYLVVKRYSKQNN